MTVKGKDEAAFESLLHEIYEAALAPEHLRALMPRVCDWLECDWSHLGSWDHRHESMTFSIMPTHLEHVERLYAEHFWRVDIRRPVMEARGIPGHMDACQYYYDDRTVGRSEFYQDLLIPHLDARYGAGGLLDKQADRFVFIVYNRSKARGEFSDEAMGRIHRITPHLQRMIKLMRQTDTIRQAANTGAQALKALSQGLLLLDRDGAILFVNDLAEQVLRDGRACSVRGERWVQGKDSDVPVSELCARVMRTGVPQSFTERVALPDGQVDTFCFTISAIMPERMGRTRFWLQADLVVNFTRTRSDDTPSFEQLHGWFGLTPAEVRLAQSLAEGKTVEQYAQQFGIKASTARTQVRSVLDKTQRESLQALMSLFGRLPSSA
jgi:DNA-binding CsgD family transcriptional regulator